MPSLFLFALISITTSHYNNARTAVNDQETLLSPLSVNATSFGHLASLPVSGCVFAQPLLVDGVLIVATTTNWVYGYRASDYSLLYSVNFGTPVPSIQYDTGGGYYDFPDCETGDSNGPIGIVGTPVADLANHAVYLVANDNDRHFLHKIDSRTGADLLPPVEIAAPEFRSHFQLQRPALLLLNGWVYVAFASHQDQVPYSGWMFAYDANLQQQVAMNYSPRVSGSGIWQSGGGPASDGRFLYFTTGNQVDGESTDADNNDSILKVDARTLAVVAKASFAREANEWDQNVDLDLGASRAVLIPDTTDVISGSKVGDVFRMETGTMALTNRFQGASRLSAGYDWTGIYNGLAVWNDTIYVWPGGGGFVNGQDPGFPTDHLRAFDLGGALLTEGQTDGAGAGYVGAGIAISANGNDAASGIVWALVPSGNTKGLQPGTLHAYAASPACGIFQELWSNNADPEVDFAKFNQPVVANGFVYLPTFSGSVEVYGLLSGSMQVDNRFQVERLRKQINQGHRRKRVAPGH